MQWFCKPFDTLTVDELYQILKLRVDVFVVEQDCAYPELDELDRHPETLHLYAIKNSQVACYLRLLAPGVSHAGMSSFGRVVTHSEHRGKGIGHDLIAKALDILSENWPNTVCHISAQAHLQSFYNKHKFRVVTDEYLEDGIPHIGMETNPSDWPNSNTAVKYLWVGRRNFLISVLTRVAVH